VPTGKNYGTSRCSEVRNGIQAGGISSQMNSMLIFGALLSASAALVHIGIILFGASWYRFFGAGERMVGWVEQGRFLPHAIAFSIAVVLMLCAAFALSGAGLLPITALTKSALVVITSAYVLRGVGGSA